MATRSSGPPGRRPDPAGVRSLAQVRALAHPTRLALLELFAEGPRTTMQAAETLGVPPTRLYHHVAALERAGLVRLRETRPKRGTTEKYYEATARRFLADLDATRAIQAAGTEDHEAIGLMVFDRARQELIQALGAGESTSLMATRAVLRLSAPAVTRLQGRLSQVLEEISSPGATAARDPSSRRFALTIGLVPLETPGVSRGRAARRGGRLKRPGRARDN